MNLNSYIDPHLPLIDLHRHLDGSIRLETIIELAQEQGIDLPAYDVESLRPYVVIDGKADGLMDFIGRFRYLTAILHDLDACRRVAYENVEDAQREGIDYIELRFSPWFMSETHELDPAGVVEAVADGIKAGGTRYRCPCPDDRHHESHLRYANLPPGTGRPAGAPGPPGGDRPGG